MNLLSSYVESFFACSTDTAEVMTDGTGVGIEPA